jgi:hypothetical protein
MRIVVSDGSEPATPDTGLVRLLVRANAIRDQLLADRSRTFEDIAKAEGVVPSYVTRLFRLTVLAPDIVSAILSGGHPTELTARRLMDDTRLPLDWNEQRRCLGFASPHYGPCTQEPTSLQWSLFVRLALPARIPLPARDCRTTKLRERDTRAMITANSARIRLSTKCSARVASQSPGIRAGIRTPAKTQTNAISVT